MIAFALTSGHNKFIRASHVGWELSKLCRAKSGVRVNRIVVRTNLASFPHNFYNGSLIISVWSTSIRYDGDVDFFTLS